MKQFSDFAKKEDINTFNGKKIGINELFDKSIIVKKYRIIPNGKFSNKPVLHLQFELDGETRTTFTNSVVLIRQCKEYESEMPFSTKIIKTHNYYTFS